MTIAPQHHLPIGGANAVNVIGAGWSALGVVVLGAAVDVVERFGIIQSQFVVLGYRKIFHVAPGSAQVEAFVQTAIRPHHDVIGVGGVKHDGMHIPVLVWVRHRAKGFAAVLGFLNGGTDQVEPIELMGARKNFLVVVGAGTATDRIGAFHPATAAVVGAPHPAFPAIEFDRCVDDIGILWGDCQTDLALIALGESGLKLCPGATAIGRLVNATLGAATHIRRHGAVVLPGGRVEHIGISRIHFDIGNAGPLTPAQGFFPGLSAVSGHEKAAIPALGPQGSLDRDPHRVGVFGMNQNGRNMLGVLEPLFHPGFAGIIRAINAVTKTYMSPTDIFPGAYPNTVGV